MKKLIICLMMFCAAGAYATGENERATSVGYVTEELTTRQDKFDKLGSDKAMTYSGTTDGVVTPRTISGDLGNESNTTNTSIPTVGAVNTKLANKQDELDFAVNTVLMNTGTAGAPSAKGIYDDTGSYLDQADSLIDAATFNAALQNAINSELSCAQRKDPNDPTSKCLLFNIFAPTPQTLLPNGFTPLEYIESTGTQYIDPGLWIPRDGTARMEMIAQINPSKGWMGANAYMQLYVGEQFLNTKGSASTGAPIGNKDNIVIEYNQNRETCYVNNQEISASSWSSITASRSAFKIFALGNYNGGTVSEGRVKSKLYELKITINGVVSNFVPARQNSDNSIGLYDTVSGRFFTNAATSGDDFTAGPVSSALNLYIPQNQ